MEKSKNTLLVGVETVQKDLGVSRAKAYQIIREINSKVKERNPDAILLAGKVNRIRYEKAIMKEDDDEKINTEK